MRVQLLTLLAFSLVAACGTEDASPTQAASPAQAGSSGADAGAAGSSAGGGAQGGSSGEAQGGVAGAAEQGGAAGVGGAAGEGGAGGQARGPWAVERGFLRDREGRAVIMRGVNLANAHKQKPYFGFHTEADFKRLRDQWGMNGIRFLVEWAAIEPEKGVYDDSYLDKVRERVQWASDAGLLVVIDMHQDVYGEGFGFNGAARWTCDEQRYKDFKPADQWFFSYLDPNVIACVDGLYHTDELRAHRAEATRRLAARLADIEAVVGLDPMNEPFWGSHSTTTFEPEVLAPFYAQMMGAAREAAPAWVAFLEPSASKNLGFDCRFEKLPVDNAMYAPHAYDATAEQGMGFTDNRAPILIKRIAEMQEEAATFGAGLWIGEYGGTSSSPGIVSYMDASYKGAGAVAASSMYWSYDRDGGYGLVDADGSDKPELQGAVVRPFPERVSGDPISYQHDRASGVFSFAYRPDRAVTAPTLVSLPEIAFPGEIVVDCGGCEHHRDGNRLVIDKPGEGDMVTVTISPAG